MITTDPQVTKLTPEQQRILLVLCDAGETNTSVRLVVTTGQSPIRETTTAAALVRKGYAVRKPNGRYAATSEGFWLGDALRVMARQGRIPARRTA